MNDDERMARVEAAAEEIANDMIHAARNSGDEPVVFVTGNRYFPIMRSYPQAEEIWQDDNQGLDMFIALTEMVEYKVDMANVYLASPEYDNCLYVVDTARFEYVEEDTEAEYLRDEWRPIHKNGD